MLLLGPSIDRWAALGIVAGLALFTWYSVAAWRGAVGRGWIERQLGTGLLFQSQMATVGLLWLAIGFDFLLGGEALLRLLDVGAAAEIAARELPWRASRCVVGDLRPVDVGPSSLDMATLVSRGGEAAG